MDTEDQIESSAVQQSRSPMPPDGADPRGDPPDPLLVIRDLLHETLAGDTSPAERWRRHQEMMTDRRDTATLARRLAAEAKRSEFDTQLATLKRQVEESGTALVMERLSSERKEERIRELQQSFDRLAAELSAKQQIGYLLSRLSDAGQKKLLESAELRNRFTGGLSTVAYVLSIDIRRSTELMLKAREPQLFASFITGLANRLRSIVVDNLGVFDKFTGDGVLAFFPDFYSGPDAGYLALKTASECHRAFDDCYKTSRTTFVSVLKDTGLGIGLDFGKVHMVQVCGDFTVVGTPVVYACRMSGASAGRTFVNQPAFEQLQQFFTQERPCDFLETDMNLKHEGSTVAYDVWLRAKEYTPRKPDWMTTQAEIDPSSSLLTLAAPAPPQEGC